MSALLEKIKQQSEYLNFGDITKKIDLHIDNILLNDILSCKYNGNDIDVITYYILNVTDRVSFFQLIEFYNISINYNVVAYALYHCFDKICNVLLNFIDNINSNEIIMLMVNIFEYMAEEYQSDYKYKEHFKVVKKIFNKFCYSINNYDIFVCAIKFNNLDFLKYFIKKQIYNPLLDNDIECIKYLISISSMEIITYFLNSTTVGLYNNNLLRQHLKSCKYHYSNSYNSDEVAIHLNVLSIIFKFGNIDLNDLDLLMKISNRGVRYIEFLVNQGIDISLLCNNRFKNDQTLQFLKSNCCNDSLICLLYTRIQTFCSLSDCCIISSNNLA